MSRQRDVSQSLRSRRALTSAGVPMLAVVAALVFGAILIVALGANPLRGYGSLLRGAFGGTDELSRTIVRAVPLMLVGAGICLAFRASVINIGGEGQMVMGGLLATAVALAIPESLPRVFALPTVLLAGTAGGFAYGAVPGALKARFNVNEILSTIMLNIVAVQFMNFLLQGTLQDNSADNTLSNIPQSRRLPRNTDLPLLPGGSQLNVGFIIAVVAAVIAWVILWRTVLGYRLRAVGFSPDAARYAGMSVKGNVTLALAISGAFCGLEVILTACSRTEPQRDSPAARASMGSSPHSLAGFIRS
jgi:general nucleoside transport system permease protein